MREPREGGGTWKWRVDPGVAIEVLRLASCGHVHVRARDTARHRRRRWGRRKNTLAPMRLPLRL